MIVREILVSFIMNLFIYLIIFKCLRDLETTPNAYLKFIDGIFMIESMSLPTPAQILLE